MPTRFKRIYFSNAPQTEQGEMFVHRNIPSQLTYQQWSDSVAFIAEPSDTATTAQRGLVKVYTDEQVISARDSSVVTKGEQRVLMSHQMPTTGVFESGNYTESNPTPMSLNGVTVKGEGIGVKGVRHYIGSLRRIGYAVTLRIDSLPSIKPDNTYYVAIVDMETGVHYRAPYGGETPPPSGDGHITLTFDRAAVTWYVIHNLGFYPSVSVEIDGILCDAECKHIDDNNVEVYFNSGKSGKVHLS